jgi:hypothetical protein
VRNSCMRTPLVTSSGRDLEAGAAALGLASFCPLNMPAAFKFCCGNRLAIADPAARFLDSTLSVTIDYLCWLVIAGLAACVP